jgi:hypothetical protein
VLQQQARFDAFVDRYNQERPHQALGMKMPADVCTRSQHVYRGVEDLTCPRGEERRNSQLTAGQLSSHRLLRRGLYAGV